MTTPIEPRPWRSNDHLRSVALCDAGRIAVTPQSADRITFDAAWSNSFPANREEGEHGSTILDIGRGVTIRATGCARRTMSTDGVPGERWTVDPSAFSTQHRSRGPLTLLQNKRAAEIISDALTAWAQDHPADIAQADDIDRNNGAHRLEETIARHQAALKILRRELRACENGRDFTMYPDLPTAR